MRWILVAVGVLIGAILPACDSGESSAPAAPATSTTSTAPKPGRATSGVLIPSPIPNEPEVSRTVLALGDSNLYFMEGSLLNWSTKRPPGSPSGVLLTAINPKIGFGACPDGTLPENYWVDFLGQARAVSSWPVYFIVLGANDAKRPPSACTNDYAAVIDAMMREIPPTSLVFWPDLPQKELPSAQLVNSALELAQTRWANLRVLPLADRWAGKPEMILETDPLHYTLAGAGDVAQWVFGPDGVIAQATAG